MYMCHCIANLVLSGAQTLKDATSFFERRLEYVTKNLENLQQGLIEKYKIRDGGWV